MPKHQPLCCVQFRNSLSRPPRRWRNSGTPAQRLDLVPELLPLLALGFGQFVERLAADASEILVLLPVLHPFAYRGAELVGLLVQQPAIRGQVGPQPVEGLAA